jgi:type I site-specific restriction-modification system R (restriction) subunit
MMLGSNLNDDEEENEMPFKIKKKRKESVLVFNTSYIGFDAKMLKNCNLAKQLAKNSLIKLLNLKNG